MSNNFLWAMMILTLISLLSNIVVGFICLFLASRTREPFVSIGDDLNIVPSKRKTVVESSRGSVTKGKAIPLEIREVPMTFPKIDEEE